MELVPTSKLLWSTDGHYYPETFWLANIQGRNAMEKVLCEYVEMQDLTVSQAVEAAKDIFFENSNRLYNLGLTFAKEGEDVTLQERPKETAELEQVRSEDHVDV